MKTRGFMALVLTITALFLCLFSGSEMAFALDEKYCKGEQFGWYEVDDITNYERANNGFDGFLKQRVDEDNGCIYFYFNAYDPSLKNCDDSAVELIFYIQNSAHSYVLAINNSGINTTTSVGQGSFNIDYNFENFECLRLGGEIFVAIEFKDATDRALLNSITCEFSPATGKRLPLFTNASYSLPIPTTASTTKPATTARMTTTKQTTTRVQGNNSATATTKFKPVEGESTTQFVPDENYIPPTQGGVFTSLRDSNARMTSSSRLAILIGVIIAIIGAFLVTFAFAKKSNKADDINFDSKDNKIDNDDAHNE